jgi:AbiV family abortive infection protein
MQIPTNKLREGCALLIEMMTRHGNTAKSLLDEKQREGAFLFFLLGLEELGKLIQLVDAGKVVEDQQSKVAEVPRFLDHQYKGAQGARNIASAIDFFIPPLQEAGLDTSRMEEYAEHLKLIKKHFVRLREDAMYVNFRADGWVRANAPREDFISWDIGILLLACAALRGSLLMATDFRGFRTFVDEMQKSANEFRADLPQLIKDIRAEVAKLLQDHGRE